MSFKIAFNPLKINYALRYKERILYVSDSKEEVEFYFISHLLRQSQIKNYHDYKYLYHNNTSLISNIFISKDTIISQKEMKEILFCKTMYSKILGESKYYIKDEREIVGIDPETFDISFSSSYPMYREPIIESVMAPAEPELITTFGSYKNLEKYFDERCELIEAQEQLKYEKLKTIANINNISIYGKDETLLSGTDLKKKLEIVFEMKNIKGWMDAFEKDNPATVLADFNDENNSKNHLILK